METLVATVLIVVIFMLSSMILNNMFSNTIKNNTSEVETYLNELEYQYQNNNIELPYQDEFSKWQITIESVKENNQQNIEFEATNKELGKTIIRRQIETN